MSKVTAKLKALVEADIIEPVTEPTEWCAPIVVAPKRNRQDIRICVNLRKLNPAVKREKYVLPTFEDISSKLQGCKVFSKLDAKDAYHQLPLHPESRRLTTFITPIGRFSFKCVPFGISSASEIYQRRISEILAGEERVAVNQDDVLLGGIDDPDHDVRLVRVKAKLADAGVELNEPKCEYSKPEVIVIFSSLLRTMDPYVQ